MDHSARENHIRHSRYRRRFAIAVGCLVSASFSTATIADTLPSAVFSGQVTGTAVISSSGQLDISNSTCNSSGCQTSEAESTAIGPYVEASGQASGLFPPSAYADSTITYYYEVIDPSATTNTVYVPLILTSRLNAGVSAAPATGTATIIASYIDGNGYESYQSNVSATYHNPVQTANVYTDLVAPANLISPELGITITAVCSVHSGLPGLVSCDAAVDPQLTIDPSFLAANPGTTVEISSNVSEVPLPAAVWLLLSGVGGLGLLRKRRPQMQMLYQNMSPSKYATSTATAAT